MPSVFAGLVTSQQKSVNQIRLYLKLG